MINRLTTEPPRAAKAPMLTAAELRVVIGGINPQPLPPRVALVQNMVVLPALALRFF